MQISRIDLRGYFSDRNYMFENIPIFNFTKKLLYVDVDM